MCCVMLSKFRGSIYGKQGSSEPPGTGQDKFLSPGHYVLEVLKVRTCGTFDYVSCFQLKKPPNKWTLIYPFKQINSNLLCFIGPYSQNFGGFSFPSKSISSLQPSSKSKEYFTWSGAPRFLLNCHIFCIDSLCQCV